MRSSVEDARVLLRLTHVLIAATIQRLAETRELVRGIKWFYLVEVYAKNTGPMVVLLGSGNMVMVLRDVIPHVVFLFYMMVFGARVVGVN